MRNILVKSGILVALVGACPQVAMARGDFRVEAHVGWDHNADGTAYRGYIFPVDLKAGGVVYGANIGYDIPLSPLVTAGVDAAISDTSADLKGNFLNQLLVGRDLYAGARVTVHPLPGLRIYAKAGYANARVTTNPGQYLTALAGQTAVDLDTIRNNGGVRVGAGVQQSLFGPLYGLAEYRYTRYANKITRNQIVTGVGLRF